MAGTFKSNDTAILEILKDIDSGSNQLPDFQRGWVWDDERIRALIASIYSAYPVGTLMFLEYGGDTVRFKYRSFTGAIANGKPNILVLYGQQRLTSIYSAMFCQKPVPTQTIKKEPIERYYYLDIQKCLDGLTDRTVDRLEAIVSIPADRIVRENFARDIKLDLSITLEDEENSVLENRDNEYKNHLFPLNIVYDHTTTGNWMDNYREYHGYDKDILKRLQLFNAEVLVPIQSYKIPVITLNASTPKEAVCQVFENVNTGGVSLTVFELVTATFAADNFDLRGDWYGVDERDKDGKEKHIPGRHEKMKEKEKLLSAVSDVDFLVSATLLSRYYTYKELTEHEILQALVVFHFYFDGVYKNKGGRSGRMPTAHLSSSCNKLVCRKEGNNICIQKIKYI